MEALAVNAMRVCRSEIETPWSFRASGNSSTIPVLIPSNSTGLKGSSILTAKRSIETTGSLGLIS